MFGHLGRAARRRRFELLDHLECLKSRRLRLADITVAGVAPGSAAAQLPLERVVAVRFAPIIAAERWTANGAQLCHDHDGRALPLTELVRSALAHDGLLVLREQVGLALRDGEVHGIEIYHPVLRHFRYIRSYVEVLAQFGLPDTVHTRHADGLPTDHGLLYREQHKEVVWGCRENALCVVRLGAADDGPRHRPPRARKHRHSGLRAPLGIGDALGGTPTWGWAAS